MFFLLLLSPTRYSFRHSASLRATVSLRLGHRAALTAHRAVIHYRTAAPLRFATSRREPKKPPGGSLKSPEPCLVRKAPVKQKAVVLFYQKQK